MWRQPCRLSLKYIRPPLLSSHALVILHFLILRKARWLTLPLVCMCVKTIVHHHCNNCNVMHRCIDDNYYIRVPVRQCIWLNFRCWFGKWHLHFIKVSKRQTSKDNFKEIVKEDKSYGAEVSFYSSERLLGALITALNCNPGALKVQIPLKNTFTFFDRTLFLSKSTLCLFFGKRKTNTLFLISIIHYHLHYQPYKAQLNLKIPVTLMTVTSYKYATSCIHFLSHRKIKGWWLGWALYSVFGISKPILP